MRLKASTARATKRAVKARLDDGYKGGGVKRSALRTPSRCAAAPKKKLSLLWRGWGLPCVWIISIIHTRPWGKERGGGEAAVAPRIEAKGRRRKQGRGGVLGGGGARRKVGRYFCMKE
jgi:hypothetical protein